ncbi:MAG: hypothetical protein ACI89X_004757 [Planctomycetota bacterium]|jgi:hypothetical protein
MNALLAGILCCLLPLSATSPTDQPQQRTEQQDPKPQPSHKTLERQLRALNMQVRAGGSSKAKASLALETLVEKRYPECYAVFQQSKDKMLRATLSQKLKLVDIREAHAILLAEAPRGEHAQGGVVDHHDMWLQFAKLDVLFANADTLKHYFSGDLYLLARGCNVDTWLCELLRRDVVQHAAAQIWVLKRRLLMHENGHSGLTYHEFVRLPASAATIVRQLRN